MNPEDRLVTVLSQWLARHVDDDELQREIDALDLSALDAEQAEAVKELRDQLAATDGRGELEKVARETLQALAIG